ncbi:MAG: SusC/RagA family TonB-linked outer membrane protein, partial [Prevotellaceae bacterium]|nr:SusC/RagA family TonB-linked outer membrane protein [Prevotellaceae bacterium]
MTNISTIFGFRKKIVILAVIFFGATFINTISAQKIKPGTNDETTVVSNKTNNDYDDLIDESSKNLTGNVGKVGSEILEQSHSGQPNILQGRVAGVRIQDGNLQLRGQNNVLQELSQPLYIVDGVPLPAQYIYTSDGPKLVNPLNLLNTTNLEKIEILKDADATAIYGGQGANGVVLITTKKVLDSRFRITAAASAGTTGVNTWYDFLSTEEYLDLRNKAFVADGIIPTTANAYDILTWGDQYHTDWQREFVGDNGEVYTGQLSLSGGSGKTTFYINTDYYQSGTVYLAQKDDKARRFNSRVLVNHVAFGGRLDITASLAFNTFNEKATGDKPDTYIVYAPNQPTYNEDGSLYWLPGNASFINPLRSKYVDVRNKNTQILSNLDIRYHIFKELEAKVTVGYTKGTADQIQTYSQSFQNPAQSYQYKNRLVAGDSYNQKYLIEPQLNFVKQFDKSGLTVLLGSTVQVANSASDNFEIRDFPTEALFNNYSSAAIKNSVASSSSGQKYLSGFGRVIYDYKSRYILSGTFRRDGSSIFASGNRYGNFWSIAGAWIFSREDFFQSNLPFINYGKVRISHGSTGNDNVAPFIFLDAYSVSSYPYNGSTGLYLSRVANPNFGWEVTRKSEIALDLTFLKDRLQLTAAAYRNNSDNLIGSIPIASQTGQTAYQDNLKDARVRNQGIELNLAATPLSIGGCEWLSTFMLSIPKNAIIVEFKGLENTSYATKYKIGESQTITRLYKFSGINPENGIPTVEDINGDGKITATDDQIFQKDTDPDYYGGFHNSFRYKGIQLDVFFVFEKRPFSEGYLKTYYYPVGYLGRNVPKKLAKDYWTPENPNASRPGLTTTTSSAIGQPYYNYY